jgi:hypothetical protein
MKGSPASQRMIGVIRAQGRRKLKADSTKQE